MLGEGGMRSCQVPSSRYILLRNSRPENTNSFLVTQGADKEEERVSTTMLENDVNPFLEKNNNKKTTTKLLWLQHTLKLFCLVQQNADVPVMCLI